MKEENQAFLDWYHNLKDYEQSYYRKKIADMCEVSRTCVYRWLEGQHKIKGPCKRVINEVAGQQLFEI